MANPFAAIFQSLVMHPASTNALTAVAGAMAALFAAVSAFVSLRTVKEMRRVHLASLRPILDLTTPAWEIEFRWLAAVGSGTSTLPGRVIRYRDEAGKINSQSPEDWSFVAVLNNLSNHAATNIRGTVELVPALSRKDVAKLGLADAIGGNNEQRLIWEDDHYWIRTSHSGSGWYDSFTIPLQVLTHLRGNEEYVVTIPDHLVNNLALLLYREAQIVGACRNTSLYIRPHARFRLSYDTPAGETVFSEYVIDLPIVHTGYEHDGGLRIDSVHGARQEWEAFWGVIRPTIMRVGSGLPRRLSSAKVRRVMRRVHPVSMGHYGTRAEPLSVRVRRAFLRAEHRYLEWKRSR